MLRGIFGSGGGAPVGGSGNPNTIPRWTGATTLGDSALVQSGTNAIGFGTPKTWGTNFTLNAIQLSESSSLSADINTTYLAANQYWDSPSFANKRIKANFAVRYLQNGATGDHSFQTAPSGAADSGISWTTAMTILNGGNVGIGTAPAERLHVVSANSLSTIIASTNATQAAVELRYNTSTTCGYFGTGAALVSGGTGPDFALRAQSGAMLFATGATERARIDSNGNIYGTSGTTGMTNGFFYIPAAAGAPTGVPTAVAGRVPMYYDTTNNQFYVYNGGWKKVTLT